MPELPDVAGFKQYLDATSLHQPIKRTSVDDERLLKGVSARQLASRLKGRSLEASQRYGKLLFVRTDDGGWLILHFGMTGELAYYKDPADEPEYGVVTWDFENAYHLAYVSRRKLGRVSWAKDLDRFIADEELGPDALADDFDSDQFIEAMQGRRGVLKSALMNQSIVAGIGNVWSDEILFQARLHPQTHVDELDDDARRSIFDIMRRVLRVGADKGGDIQKLPQDYFLPHREGDGVCPECGGDIETITVSGRTAHWCPKCQKKP